MAAPYDASRVKDVQAQIDRLRAQVEALTQDRVTPVVKDFADRTQNVIPNIAGTVRGQAQAASGQVKARPLTANLIAFAVGWVAGRFGP
jgi:hypothetical protein